MEITVWRRDSDSLREAVSQIPTLAARKACQILRNASLQAKTHCSGGIAAGFF
jgi:hypothetical protein